MDSGDQMPTRLPSKEILELGFTTLHEGPDPIVDIVFIHGLQGHPRHTWTFSANTSTEQKPKSTRLSRALRNLKQSSKSTPSVTVDQSRGTTSDIYWPQDLLPGDIEHSRILTWGYDSRVTKFFQGATTQNGILHHGRDFLYGLEVQRREWSNRPLIFVVHSLGGIILKEALRRARSAGEEDRDLLDIYRATLAIVFFGTPHRGGSTYVDWGLIAKNIAVAAGFDANDRVLKNLKPDSEQLEALREEFQKILDEKTSFFIQTFQENRGLKGVQGLTGKVVDDASSGLDHKFERKSTINSNHMGMCRFSGRKDDGYIKVVGALSRYLEFISKTAGKTIERASLPQNSTDTRERMSMRKEEECIELKKSLFKPEVFYRRDDVDDAYSKTFEWLWAEPTHFQDWLQSGQGIYWINGLPASGKSTLMKYALRHRLTSDALRRSRSVTSIKTAFFFHSRGLRHQKSFDGLLYSILYEILHETPELSVAILPAYQNLHPDVNKREWTTSALKSALSAIKTQDVLRIDICLFIDALDEYESSHLKLGMFLKDLAEGGPSTKIKLCLASRQEPEFVTLFSQFPGFQIHERTVPDILHYTRSKLEVAKDTSYLGAVDNDQTSALNTVVDFIVRNAEGVFLWVSLVVEDILHGLSHGDSLSQLQNKLAEVPTELDSLYRYILHRIHREHRFEAYKMLEIARCTEPLPLEYFTLFFDVSDDFKGGLPEYACSQKYRDQEKNLCKFRTDQMVRQLRSRCRGLLEIKSRHNGYRSIPIPTWGIDKPTSVEFLHRTAKDFLKNPKNTEPLFTASPRPVENGYVYLMRGYLRFIAAEDGLAVGFKQKFCLHFGHWARLAEETVGSISLPILEKFGTGQWFFKQWRSAVQESDTAVYIPATVEEFAALYRLLLFMEKRIRQGLLQNARSPVIRPKSDGPPMPLLCLALGDANSILYNYGEVGFRIIANPQTFKLVELLLKNGADPNEESRVRSPLLSALHVDTSDRIPRPDLKIIELLLSYGASANKKFRFSLSSGPLGTFSKTDSPRKYEFYPLHLAVEQQNMAMIDLLFRYGAHLRVHNRRGETPLQLAARLLEERPSPTTFEIVDKLSKIS